MRHQNKLHGGLHSSQISGVQQKSSETVVRSTGEFLLFGPQDPMDHGQPARSQRYHESEKIQGRNPGYVGTLGKYYFFK